MRMLQTFSSCAGNNDVAMIFENYWLIVTIVVMFGISLSWWQFDTKVFLSKGLFTRPRVAFYPGLNLRSR